MDIFVENIIKKLKRKYKRKKIMTYGTKEMRCFCA